MITHERLTEQVARRGGLDGGEKAVRPIRVVLGALTHRLDLPRRRLLREAVPAPERDAAYATVPPAADGFTGLVAEVGRYLHVPPERAYLLARAVVSQVADDEPGLGRELRAHLPDDYAPLFSPPDPYPDRMNRAVEAPAPLGPDELAAELRRRPLWNADGQCIVRAVDLPHDRLPPLLHGVRRAAHDLNHHVDARRTDEGIAFTLRTRSVDAVTRLDLALADRIDAAVASVGSGGRPG